MLEVYYKIVSGLEGLLVESVFLRLVNSAYQVTWVEIV